MAPIFTDAASEPPVWSSIYPDIIVRHNGRLFKIHIDLLTDTYFDGSFIENPEDFEKQVGERLKEAFIRHEGHHIA